MNTDKYTMSELIEMEASACAAPKRNTRRIEALRWAITDRVRQNRLAQGHVVNDAGYTGRNSKKR